MTESRAVGNKVYRAQNSKVVNAMYRGFPLDTRVTTGELHAAHAGTMDAVDAVVLGSVRGAVNTWNEVYR